MNTTDYRNWWNDRSWICWLHSIGMVNCKPFKKRNRKHSIIHQNQQQVSNNQRSHSHSLKTNPFRLPPTNSINFRNTRRHFVWDRQAISWNFGEKALESSIFPQWKCKNIFGNWLPRLWKPTRLQCF